MAVLGKNIWGAWPLIIWEAIKAKRNYYRTNYWCIAKKNFGGYTLETRRRAGIAESPRIEAPRGVGFLGSVPLPVPCRLGGLGERREPPTHSRHISGPQKSSSRNNALRSMVL